MCAIIYKGIRVASYSELGTKVLTMSLSTMRTTFNAKDLERAAKAPHKIYGLYEQMGQPGRYKHLSEDPSVQLDSGLGDELPEVEDCRPTLLGVPPSALADSENHDSGLGTEPETMELEEDDVERDHAVVSRPPLRATSQPERPRKPRTTTAFPKASSAPSLRRSQAQPTTTVANHSPALLPTHSSYRNQLTEEHLPYFLPNKDGDT